MDVLSESLDQPKIQLPWYYKVYQGWWACVLAVTLLSTYSCSWIVHHIPKLALQTKQTITCQICHYFFYFALCCTPWIKWEFVDFMDWPQVFQNKDGRGTFLMLNHTSFLDGIWASAFLPAYGIGVTRTLMKSSLFKIPVFGGISRMAGHFGVHFRSSEAGNFSVDKEAQTKVNALVEKHIESGGSIGLFPEGQINSEPRQLQTFRRGAFNYVKKHKLRVWALLATGAYDSWPKSSALGGFPTKMKLTLVPIFTEEEVEKMSVPELCDTAQIRMQKELNVLYGDGPQTVGSERKSDTQEDDESGLRKRTNKVRAI